MSNHRFGRIFLALAFLAGTAIAQETPAFDPEACAKHCREMAAAREKCAEAYKARTQQREAAWKEIEAQLKVARESRGDQKLAALETAIEKLVAYETATATPDCPMMGGAGTAMGMGCCGAAMAEVRGGAPPGCCGAGHHRAWHAHCPTMKGASAPRSAP